jgi:hypothetical protein
MKRAADNTGLAFVWQNKEERNFREIRNLVKYGKEKHTKRARKEFIKLTSAYP